METPVFSRGFIEGIQSLCVVALVAFGFACFRNNSVYQYVYWGSVITLFGLWYSRKQVRALLGRRHFDTRIRTIFSDSESSELVAAAIAIREGQEERALFLLRDVSQRSEQPRIPGAQRWLTALASAQWMMRQNPGRPVSGFYQRFPQIHCAIFCHDTAHAPLRGELLAREISSVTSGQLDELAKDYIALIDMLIDALRNPEAPFAEEAEELLVFTTGINHSFGIPKQMVAWWSRLRPVLVRGGGALLVGLRLLQREYYAETTALLKRLEKDGLLSAETDTIQRAASFLTLFARPRWRMAESDIQRYFTDGCYHQAIEMGVLRFPTAGLSEVVNCCRRGAVLMANKRQFVDDSLELWNTFGDELAPRLSFLLKQLLEIPGKSCPKGLDYWRKEWKRRQENFELPASLLMQGICAAASRRMDLAERLFEKAARLKPQSSVPWVNLVYLRLISGKAGEARTLANAILKRYPRDGPTLISLGRLYALHLGDTQRAEELFMKAKGLSDTPIEALICLGEVKLSEGLYLDSQAYFDRAKQLDPGLPDPKLGLARIYLETRRFDLAVENLQSVVKDGSMEARNLAYFLLYRMYKVRGEDRSAVECLDKIPAGFFKEPKILDEIAAHLENEKLYTTAREFAEQAMILRALEKEKGGE